MHGLGGAPSWEDAGTQRGIRIDAETLKYVADQMVCEAGVDVLLHTLVTGALAKDGHIQALIFESKSGRQAAKAKVVIDATGDGDIAVRAGAVTELGRDHDGRVQAMASFMHIDGIEGVDADGRHAARQTVEQALLDGRLHLYHPFVDTGGTFHRGYYASCMARQPGDPTDVNHLTTAEMGVRHEAWQLIKLLREEVPGFENAYLRALSPQVGVRESRRVMGEYVLSGEDVRLGRKHAGAVARGSWWIDIHCPRGLTYPVQFCAADCPEADACPYWASESGRSMRPLADLYPPDDDWYDIPYGCLTPKGMRNLLVAGRCISATHQGIASARVMGTCVAVGQAAGSAAALAARGNLDPHDVDVEALREVLHADGALV
jgi:hypothetical protein